MQPSIAERIGVDATGLVLAGGAGRRFGTPKALIEFQGARLVDRAARLLRDGGCTRVSVVSGAVPLDVPDAETVHNARWHEGMGSSLRTGLAAIGDVPNVVVIPVDMPWLGVPAVTRVIDAGLTSRAAGEHVPDAGALDGRFSLAVATYGGVWAHPVFLGAAHFPGVAASAVGDAGARHYLATRRTSVIEVPCDGTGSPRDIDVPTDLY